MSEDTSYWYTILNGYTFLKRHAEPGGHRCPYSCHTGEEPVIVLYCSHCRPEQEKVIMDIDTKLENIVKTIAYATHLPDREKLVGWATNKLKEVMVDYAQVQRREAEQDS